jgi:hypothetical protein
LPDDSDRAGRFRSPGCPNRHFALLRRVSAVPWLVYAALFKRRVANAVMPIMIAVQEQRPSAESFDKSPEMVQSGRRRPPEPFGERDSSSSDTIQNTTAVSYPWATIPDAKRPEEHCG